MHEEILAWCESPIRWPEQTGFKVFITTINIFNIFRGRCLPTIQMMESMIADGVSGTGYLHKYFKMFFDIVANTKESCKDVTFLQNVEYIRSDLWNWAIIKC